VIVPNAVDVIEDECHRASTPEFALPAKLALSPLEALVEEPPLECPAAVCAALDEGLAERRRSAAHGLPARGVRVEVLRRDFPDGDPLRQDLLRAPGMAHPEPAERLRVAP
jgi:hypothetical protein